LSTAGAGWNSRFPLEPCNNAFGIVAEDFGQEFDRDTATQLCVGSLIDVAHAARTETTRDFVVCEFGSDHGVHEFRLRILSNYPHVIQPFDTYDRNEMKMNVSAW
jgi:hypothetical protein